MTRASSAVAYAIKTGKMPPAKGLPCAHCGQPAVHYHHYNGYAPVHRLDVIPLCLQCHSQTRLDSGDSIKQFLELRERIDPTIWLELTHAGQKEGLSLRKLVEKALRYEASSQECAKSTGKTP